MRLITSDICTTSYIFILKVIQSTYVQFVIQTCGWISHENLSCNLLNVIIVYTITNSLSRLYYDMYKERKFNKSKATISIK